MARLNPRAGLKDSGAVEEPAQEDVGQVDGEEGAGRDGVRQNRRLTFDMDDMQDLAGLKDDLSDDLNLQEFVQWAAEDPKLLYKVMASRVSNEINEYKQSIERMKRVCEKKIESKNDALRNLMAERDEVRRALERMTIRYTNLADSDSAPSSSSKGPKIPDGKKLTDGVKPRYESWKIDVQGKLRALANQYSTPESRILYVKSMCEGDAADHLMARMRDDSPDPYLDADEMFEHLDTIYLDANREINAKADFRVLMQKNMRFQTFLSKFNLLAMDAKKARSEWKEELYHKLNSDMKRAMIKEANDPIISYAEFVSQCTMVANRLEQIAREEKSVAKDSKDSKDSKDAKPKGQGSGGSGRQGAARAPRVELTDQERKDCKENELCYDCKQPGHIARFCPLRKKAATEVKNVEATEPAAEQENAEA
jgi:hypothetical protein